MEGLTLDEWSPCYFVTRYLYDVICTCSTHLQRCVLFFNHVTSHADNASLSIPAVCRTDPDGLWGFSVYRGLQ